MLLANKTAIVYGAGDVGSAVAHAFAGEGARILITSRTLGRAEALAAAVRAAGGKAEAAALDVLDPEATARHAEKAVSSTGGIDITFHAIDLGDAQGAHVVDTPLPKFLEPIDVAMRTHISIASAVAPHMTKRGRGVIMGITANVARMAIPNVAGFAIACAATESLFRQFAAEMGPQGIRAVCVRSAGSPDTRGVNEVFNMRASEQGITREEFDTQVGAGIPLRRLPRIGEVASAAVLLASDKASAVTGAVLNVTCGTLMD
jgi:NAD(P)-dependent dehydrogenase (short-subunit alcohol dehydrogenase family)